MRARCGVCGVVLAVALAVLLPACAALRPPPDVTPDALLWTRSAEHQAGVEQVFRLARLRLDEALASPDWTAALEQTGDYADLPPAVVMDVDEVVLDTWEFQAELARSGGRFDPERWDAWVHRESATAMPGARAFTDYARAHGVRILYVTNRAYPTEDATRRNLERLGFPVDADGANILCQGERPDWRTGKRTRRAYVAERHRILLLVGDDLNDFLPGADLVPAERRALAERWSSYWGRRWIVVPNPVYGGWKRALRR